MKVRYLHVGPTMTATLPDIAGLVVCQTLMPAEGRGVLFHKGYILGQSDDFPRLRALSDGQIPLLEAEPDDLHEDDAARRLAAALIGPGVIAEGPVQGRMNLRATHRGCLMVDVDTLATMNAVRHICLFTLFDGQVVASGEVVAGAKVMPLLVQGDSVRAVEAIAMRNRQAEQGRGVVGVRPFVPQVVGVVATERLNEQARKSFQRAISRKVQWFGSHVLEIVHVPDAPDAVRAALDMLLERGATMLCTAGANVTNPADAILVALEHLGAQMEHQGAPAHPGTLFWLAYVRDIPVFGLPLCGMFSQETVADLILPHLMTGQHVTHAQIAALGHGGLFTGGMAYRFPNYASADQPI